MSEVAPRRRQSKRRQRVLEGALKAISRHGVEGLTHRRVAEAAGVSVSATTYHFATLEDLLEAAIREAVEHNMAQLRERFSADTPASAPQALADYIVESATSDRQDIVVASELYVAALRRERLRDVAAAWDQAWIELLTPLVGDAAEATTAAIGGLLMRAALYEGQRDPAELAATIRALLTR